MKSSVLALFVTFVTSVYAAAISLEDGMRHLEKRAEGGDIVSTTLEDGRNKLDIFEDGVLEGSIIETEDGGGSSIALFKFSAHTRPRKKVPKSANTRLDKHNTSTLRTTRSMLMRWTTTMTTTTANAWSSATSLSGRSHGWPRSMGRRSGCTSTALAGMSCLVVGAM